MATTPKGDRDGDSHRRCEPHRQNSAGPEAAGAVRIPHALARPVEDGAHPQRQTSLTPEDDDLLTPYLWSIAREIAKTAIENGQSLIIEGCYIPFDWKKDFSPEYLAEIECCWLVMTRRYLEEHGDDVAYFANVVERRLCDEIDIAGLIAENECTLAACEEHGLPYCLVDDAYAVEEKAAEILTARRWRCCSWNQACVDKA